MMLCGTNVIWRTVVGRLDVIDVLLEVKSFYSELIQQCCVAQVVRHHDRWIKRAEVQSRDGSVIISFLRLDNRSTFVLFIGP
jgi:hypothetical protein